MSGTNHVAGGIVFTGIFCSLWDINIFSTPGLIGSCAFFSILPDIDHTRSPIGKLFYPLAKFLDRRFGHRTITHSLLVFLFLGLFIALIEKSFFPSTGNISVPITLIYFFSFLSHLIFDMMTKQGVPLLYPFRRNPCVIPGNPDFRFKSSDLRTEAFIFSIFICLSFFCQPLFARGFWTTYNRSFGTLKHLAHEFKTSDYLLSLDYEYSKHGNNIKGTGFVTFADPTRAIIFNNGFITIEKEYKIINLLPEHTSKSFNTNELFFYNITGDSLLKLVTNKPILSLKIQSQTKISYSKDNKPSTGTTIDLDYVYNPKLLFIEDSIHTDIEHQIALTNYELRKIQTEKKTLFQYQKTITDSLVSIKSKVQTMELYDREKAVHKIKDLENKIASFRSYLDESAKYILQLNHLKSELRTSDKQTCNGYILYLNL